MRPVSVVGNSGSGKSRLARRIAAVLEVPCVEFDAIHHQANWQPVDPQAFQARIASIAAADAWVTDRNYRTALQDVVWDRADVVAWLDLPRRVVLRQVTIRTLFGVLTRKRLWNGNREPFGNLWRWDPDRSIIRWSWTQHERYAERYLEA